MLQIMSAEIHTAHKPLYLYDNMKYTPNISLLKYIDTVFKAHLITDHVNPSGNRE